MPASSCHSPGAEDRSRPFSVKGWVNEVLGPLASQSPPDHPVGSWPPSGSASLESFGWALWSDRPVGSKIPRRISPVVQWLGLLPLQGAWVLSVVREDPGCRSA